MFLTSVCSSFCLLSSMFRSLTPLFGVALHDSNVARFACKSVCELFHMLFCLGVVFNLALFLPDHGFDPPYGSNHLPIVNFLYA